MHPYDFSLLDTTRAPQKAEFRGHAAYRCVRVQAHKEFVVAVAPFGESSPVELQQLRLSASSSGATTEAYDWRLSFELPGVSYSSPGRAGTSVSQTGSSALRKSEKTRRQSTHTK